LLMRVDGVAIETGCKWRCWRRSLTWLRVEGEQFDSLSDVRHWGRTNQPTQRLTLFSLCTSIVWFYRRSFVTVTTVWVLKNNTLDFRS